MILRDWIQIRMTPDEKAMLNRLAQETGRSRSNLARGLILLGVKNPDTLRALGEVPMVSDQAERVS